MANSGLIQGTVSQNSSYYRSWIYWRESSQDITNNKTTLIVEVLVDSNNTYDWNGNVYDFQLTINGSTYTEGTFNSNSDSGWSYSSTASPTGEKAEIIYSKTVTVSHNSDGTKKVDMDTYFRLPSGGWGPGTVEVSGDGTLDTIPRASKPTLSDNHIWMRDEAVTVSTNRTSTSFTHTITYKFGTATGTIGTAQGVTDSVSWTPPLDLAHQIPSTTSGSATIYCETFDSNGSSLGKEQVGCTLYIPTDITPTFSSVTHSENVSDVSTKIGEYVQSLSKLNMGISGASGVYSSTIDKYEISFEGKAYKSNSVVSDVIKGSGTISITGKITDSRGRTASKSANIAVLPYEPPQITKFTIQRANSDGTLNDMGTHAQITQSGTTSSLNMKNNYSYKIYSKVRGTTDWGTAVSSDTSTDGTTTMDQTHTLSNVYDATNSYDFRLDFTDKFNTTLTITVLATGEVTMSWSPNGIGVGKVWEQGVLDVGGNSHFNGYTYFNNTSTINSAGENTEMLRFNTQRPWAFYERSNGSTTYLGLKSIAGSKSLIIESSGDDRAFEVHARDIASGGSWVNVYGELQINGVELVEQGSNSNGHYLKFSNGMQICQYSISQTTNTLSATGVLYRSDADHTWYFPATFSSSPSVYITIQQSEVFLTHVNNITSTACTYRAVGSRSFSDVYIPHRRIAIGTWK